MVERYRHLQTSHMSMLLIQVHSPEFTLHWNRESSIRDSWNRGSLSETVDQFKLLEFHFFLPHPNSFPSVEDLYEILNPGVSYVLGRGID